MEDNEIKRIYNEEYIGQHIGAYTLNKKYGVDLYDLFHKLDLPLRNNQEKNRKYEVNTNYFDVIDTEEKAYWLGFIYADGFITHGTNTDVLRFGISITEGDTNHLEKLKRAINADAPIHHYIVKQGYKIGTGYCRLIVSDDKFAKNLIKHGCVERKSNILKPPIGVPANLEKHFIRGFMDGNGSITQNNSKYGLSYTIKWTSTDDVLLWIQNHLIKNNILEHNYKLYKRKEGQAVSQFEFGGNYLVKKYLDYIYDGASVWLDRKYERYLRLTDLINERDARKNKIHSCDYCGITSKETDVYQFLKYKNEYYGNYYCRRHYQQIIKKGTIVEDQPERKTHCDVCGDDIGKMTLVGNKYKDYYGMTLCKRHYGQLYTYGEVKDNIKGVHKNVS